MNNIAATVILPTAIEFEERLARSIAAVAGVSARIDVRPQVELLEDVCATTNHLKVAIEKLEEARRAAESLHGSAQEQSFAYRDRVVPAMVELRNHADRLEAIVDDDLWPLPKYREMLFLC
jgi:glutamine synthetase